MLHRFNMEKRASIKSETKGSKKILRDSGPTQESLLSFLILNSSEWLANIIEVTFYF